MITLITSALSPRTAEADDHSAVFTIDAAAYTR